MAESLAQFPDLVAQWHPTLNGDLRPDDVSAGSNKKVWWKCPEGPDHEWQASGKNRSRGSGCPCCAGQQVSVTNSLARFPDLVAQWHPTLNGDLRPDDVVAGSNKKVWWKCPEGPDHEWQASGKERSSGLDRPSRSGRSRNTGCPFCRGFRASVTNSVAQFPDLVAQWHPTLNGDLRPEDVVARSHKMYWWKCPEGPDHEWQASPDRRSVAGCPFCRGYRVSVTNTLAQFPDLVAQWHPTLNGDLRPEDVVAGSHIRLWWKCPEGPDHEWQATGDKRQAGYGCPFCSSQRVSVTNSLARFPDLAAQWHPTLNGDLRPDDVVAGSGKKVWWKCPDDPEHEWQALIYNRLAGVGCPACTTGGYNPSKPGAVYVMCGDQWGKVGISNVLERRLAKHLSGAMFGVPRTTVDFTDGTTPIRIEQRLCAFIADRTSERAPQGVDGYTESFPARLFDEVHAELERLLDELPRGAWTVVAHPEGLI